MTELHDLIDT